MAGVSPWEKSESWHIAVGRTESWHIAVGGTESWHCAVGGTECWHCAVGAPGEQVASEKEGNNTGQPPGYRPD